MLLSSCFIKYKIPHDANNLGGSKKPVLQRSFSPQDLRSVHFRHFFDILNILKNKSKYEKYEKSQKFKNTEWRFGSNQTTICRVVHKHKVITITSIMFECTIVVVLMMFVLLYARAARFFYLSKPLQVFPNFENCYEGFDETGTFSPVVKR